MSRGLLFELRRSRIAWLALSSLAAVILCLLASPEGPAPKKTFPFLVSRIQRGMMPRYWIKYLGGKSKVVNLVGLAPLNYGTGLGSEDMHNKLGITKPCPTCDQQQYDSRFIRRLNDGDDTSGAGSFTQIATDEDEIIIPHTACFLRGTERTRNVTLQNYI